MGEKKSEGMPCRRTAGRCRLVALVQARVA